MDKAEINYINSDDEMSIVEIISILFKRKLIIAFGVLFTLIISYAYIIAKKPVYESNAIISIGYIGKVAPMIYIGKVAPMTDNQVGRVYIEAPESLSKELTTISSDLSVKHERDSQNIINLKVQKDDPNKARESLTKITNDIIMRHDLMFQQVVVSRKQHLDSLRKRLSIVNTNFNHNEKGLSNQEKLKVIEIQSDLERQIVEQELLLSGIYLKPTKLLQEPTLNPKPVKPDKLKIIVIALFLGVMLGVMLALLVEYFQKYFDAGSLKMPTSK